MVSWGKVGVAIGITALWTSLSNLDLTQTILVLLFVQMGILGVSLAIGTIRYLIAIPYIFYAAKEDVREWRLRRKQAKCGHPDTDVMFVYKLNTHGEVRENLQCRLCGAYPYPWWPNAKKIGVNPLNGKLIGWK